MPTIHFTIDGKPVSCEKDTTLLDVALANGFEIPAPCYRQAQSPYGACVEVCPTRNILVREEGGEREMVLFGTKHKLVACPECGRGYVTEKQSEFLKQELGDKSAVLSGCPVCKGRRRAEELQKVYESLSTDKEELIDVS